MQDAFGVRIDLDQSIAFMTGYDSTKWLVKGTVVGFTPKKVRILREGHELPDLRNPNLTMVRGVI
jgi:hypothetical protein